MRWRPQQNKIRGNHIQPCYELINALQACRLDVICCSDKPGPGPLLTTLWDLCAGTAEQVYAFPQFERHPVLLLARHPRILDPGVFLCGSGLPGELQQVLGKFENSAFTRVDPAQREFFLMIGNLRLHNQPPDDHLVQGNGEAFTSWADFSACAALLHQTVCAFV